MTSKKNSNAAERFIFTASDEELLDELDVVVARATQGDSRAVGAVAIGFGPMLMSTARSELGELWQENAGDVVQEFHVRLLTGQLMFPRIRGAAIPWMKRVVRGIAREQLGEEEYQH
jgi:hypothetical protein